MSRPKLPSASDLEPFPHRWQDACRAVLTLYCDLPGNRKGGMAMKMTRLRNEIMEDFDTSDHRGRIPDKALGRESLEHWMKGTTYLSDAKFQYVDRWIRKMRRTEVFSGIMRDLVDFKEINHRNTFVELYSRSAVEAFFKISDDVLIEQQGVLYLSELLQVPKASSAEGYSRYAALADYRQIALYIRTASKRSASITVAYIDVPISTLRADPDPANWAVCFGYLTIIGSDDHTTTIDAVMHLFRNGFPGYPSGGTSTSEVSIYLTKAQLQTSWFPQICTQNITGHYTLEQPRIGLASGFEFEEKEGLCRFTRTVDFPNISIFLANLTNSYLIW